ncbi:hypothetical protein Tco_1326573 [Tanacetum coccineum]
MKFFRFTQAAMSNVDSTSSPGYPNATNMMLNHGVAAVRKCVKHGDGSNAPHVDSTVIVLPQAIYRKKNSFKFANFVADKEEFPSIVKEAWENELRDKLKVAQLAVNNNPYDGVKKEFVSQVLCEYNIAFSDEGKLLYQMAKVTDKEVKEDMFGINSSKAHGLDGYTVCFFKKAWDIVGSDICYAVKEFFANGKFLKEINTTLIALIPKVDNACCVSDYRPIACCNFKYHAGCKEIKLTHLCFADDLLVMCYGNVESVKVVKEALEMFSSVSGQKPNMRKSTIFFGNVDIGEKNRIMEVMPFQEGRFTMRYLGAPLINKRLSKDDYKQLIDKASVFLLPKSTVKDIERILKGFLWAQGDMDRGKAKMLGRLFASQKCRVERNRRLFTPIKREEKDLLEAILEVIMFRIVSLRANGWYLDCPLKLISFQLWTYALLINNSELRSVWYDVMNVGMESVITIE